MRRSRKLPAGLFTWLSGSAFPRFADIFLWIARPQQFTAPFGGSWIWPLLGIIFLPFTTLIYVLLWQFPQGVTGWDWLWIAIAFLLDVSHWAATASQRNQIPGRAM